MNAIILGVAAAFVVAPVSMLFYAWYQSLRLSAARERQEYLAAGRRGLGSGRDLVRSTHCRADEHGD